MVARTLMRLFRLLKLYARMDILAVTGNPKIFLGWALSDAVLNVGSITGMLLLAERFSGIGIWSKFQIYFLLGYAALVEGLVNTFFGYNVAFISRRLGRGQFDHTLIQPQPIWMSLLTEGFSPVYGLPTLIPGLVLLTVALPRLPIAPSAGWFLHLLFYLAASVTVLMAFQFGWGSLAFWQPRAAEEINSSTSPLMLQLKGFPLERVGSALHFAMLTALPVGFLSWVPCRALLGLDRSLATAWSTPLAALLFATLATAIFLRGKAHYARTGAQRYNDFGHRR